MIFKVTQEDRDLLAAFYLMVDWLEDADRVTAGDCLTADETRMLDDIALYREQAEAAAKNRE